jgi:V/A-type H+-transporting ATPase subunit E
MGLEKVIEQIQKEGEEKISAILQDAEKQKAEMLQVTKQALASQAVQKKQETEQLIRAMQTQEKSALEMEVKKLLLNAEKEVLTSTYQQCLASLQSLPHEKILPVLMRQIQEELPEAALVYSNKRDETVVRKLSKLTYAGTIECVGGLIVENSEKTMKVDLRYETIAARVWEQSLKEIASLLFR